MHALHAVEAVLRTWAFFVAAGVLLRSQVPVTWFAFLTLAWAAALALGASARATPFAAFQPYW